jgi:hypothetical protein
MGETERIVLDYTIGLEVTHDTCFNEIISLQSLKLGLLQLAIHI